MESSGEILRRLREEKGLPLRTIASFLDIDQAILSKIERGQRKASRQQISNLAAYFGIDENTLMTAWLSDKVMYAVRDEEMSVQALQLAEERVAYMVKQKPIATIVEIIKSFLQKDGRVSSAWLFGSFARGEQKSKSDVDLMIELNNEKKYSMFDIIDISFLIEKQIGKKVDIVEKGYLKGFALEHVENDLIKIYG